MARLWNKNAKLSTDTYTDKYTHNHVVNKKEELPWRETEMYRQHHHVSFLVTAAI